MLIYVYCITNKEPNLNGAKELVRGLYFISEQGLYAVVSEEKEEEFDQANLEKNLSNLEWIKQLAVLHEKVIEQIMEQAGVIPFKFGTLFNNEQNLKAMLVEHEDEFKTDLDQLADKEEWGVKVYCDKEKLKQTVDVQNEEIKKIDDEINASSPGKAFILKKKKEELLDVVLSKTLNTYIQESFDQLGQHCEESRLNRVLPKEVTGRKGEMILNAAYLVAKDQVTRFNQEADRLNPDGKEKGISLDVSGPWPPYNFCLPRAKSRGLSANKKINNE
ncbi:GvpL/GvpF family gas vesicle protein [Candidatus Saganbacteria bacterium]|nr:GvpL/GvpF family gas vesicle protein [Candidatus Saganbacteria bacterium]